MKENLFGRVVLAVGIVILCGGCGSRQEIFLRRYTDTAMGTVVQQSLYTADEETAGRFSEESWEILERLEGELLSWRLDTSEVYRANTLAGSGEGHPLSGELAALLADCAALSEDSGGAFSVTLGSLVQLWNIDAWAAGGQEGTYRKPSAEAVERALKASTGDGFRLVREEQQQILYLPEGMQLDFGAVGKGLALTKLQALLEGEPEIEGAVIAVGGSVLTYGSKPDKSAWKVGITDPFDTSSNVGVLTLDGQWCVSTSGDYERYAEADGVRYHHILDPATGYPADSGVHSATILTKEGMMSDALSTACFILGAEKGMELAGRYGAEVLFVLEDGELVMSDGMERYFSGRQRNRTQGNGGAL